MFTIQLIHNKIEHFPFIRLPKIFFNSSQIRLSLQAKLLYALLLDRVNLSLANGWYDSDHRVFIIYTIEEASKTLGCGKNTAIKAFAELDSEKGIGLIQRIRKGRGQADHIYVNEIVVEREQINPMDSVDKFTQLLEVIHDADLLCVDNSVDNLSSNWQRNDSQESLFENASLPIDEPPSTNQYKTTTPLANYDVFSNISDIEGHFTKLFQDLDQKIQLLTESQTILTEKIGSLETCGIPSKLKDLRSLIFKPNATRETTKKFTFQTSRSLQPQPIEYQNSNPNNTEINNTNFNNTEYNKNDFTPLYANNPILSIYQNQSDKKQPFSTNTPPNEPKDLLQQYNAYREFLYGQIDMDILTLNEQI